MNDITPTTSGDMETYDPDAVMRASLARCASKMKDGIQQPNVDAAPVPKRHVGFTKGRVGGSSRQFSTGPSRLARLISSQRSSTGTMGATKREVDAWEARPLYVEEEPEPWGQKVVTAATGVQRMVQ